MKFENVKTVEIDTHRWYSRIVVTHLDDTVEVVLVASEAGEGLYNTIQEEYDAER